MMFLVPLCTEFPPSRAQCDHSLGDQPLLERGATNDDATVTDTFLLEIGAEIRLGSIWLD